MNSIQIQPCANGYMVREAPDWTQERSVIASETHVFESFGALTKYLMTVLPSPPLGTTITTTAASRPRR